MESNPITLDEGTLEEVETFMYLGSIIDERRGSNVDMKVRIGKVRAAFLQLKCVCNSKQLIFNTNVKAVLVYGAETCMYYHNHHQRSTSISKQLST